MSTKTPRTCALCEATCGLVLTTEGDRVTAIRGDVDDVFSRGFICPKGTALSDLHDDPDRLRQPMVRDSGGVLRPASWEEAFDAVEAGLVGVLEDFGKDAVAVYLGNPNVHNLGNILFGRALLKAIGTRNLYTASTVDQMPKHVSSGLLFGHPDTIAVPDIDRTDFLLILGANPMASNGSLATAPDWPGRMKAITRRGGRLVVVDPRRTRTAALADTHIPITPGTDALLLLAMIHVVLTRRGPRLRHLAGFTDNLEAITEVAARFTPSRVEARCGIDAATIESLALQLFDAPSAAVYGRIGTQTTRFGTLAAWAVDVLNIVTGNLDREGGAMFPLGAHTRPRTAPGGRGFQIGRWHSRVHGHPEVRSEYPVATLADEILTDGEGQVRALLTVAGNPARSTPNSDKIERALPTLDFMVSVDLYLNETTRHADVILPPPSPLERDHYDLAFYGLAVRNVANFSPALFTPEGPGEVEILSRIALIASGQGAKADPSWVETMVLAALHGREAKNPDSPIHKTQMFDVISQLTGDTPEARVLDLLLRTGPYGDGFGANPGGLTVAKLLEHPHGIDLGPLKPRLPTALETVSGRIDLLPPEIASQIEALEALEAPSSPFTLIGRRHLRSNNSWMHNVERLATGKGRCALMIHPEDAARLELAAGDVASVRSAAGTLQVPITITDGIMRGVVSLPHGWGHDAEGAQLGVAARFAGVNSNRLTDETVVDPLSGNCALNGIPVWVEAG